MAATTKKTRVFISFDYDDDSDLRVVLVGQTKHHNTPFAFEDWSVKQAARGWKEDARKRIGRSDVVIVVCGHYTNTAVGVAAEIKIAREEKCSVLAPARAQERRLSEARRHVMVLR